MEVLLVATNEKNKLVYVLNLDTKEENGSATVDPLAFLLAYSSLDSPMLNGYDGHWIETHLCASGHKFILVGHGEKWRAVGKFWEMAERVLKELLFSPYTDDRDWLGEAFGNGILTALANIKGNKAE